MRCTRPALLGALICLTGCVTDNPATTTADAAPPGDAGPADGAPPADSGGECAPTFSVSAPSVSFPRGPAFETQTRTVELTNTAACALDIDGVALNGARAFRVLLDDADLAIDQAPLADPDADGAPGLAAQGTLTLTVTFTPSDEAPVEGELRIRTSGGEAIVALNGNRAGPCIEVAPRVLEFRAQPNDSRVAEIQVTSCGDAPATVHSAVFSADGAAAFTLVAEESTALPFVLAPAGAGGGDSLRLTVRFAPDAMGTFNSALIVESDGLAEPARVQLVGRAQDNACPIAVTPADVAVRPLDVVTLDGSASRDPDGPGGLPVQWQWNVIDRPDGSTAVPVERLHDAERPDQGGIADDLTTPTAALFIDLAGQYVVELVVIDANDLSSADCGTNATFVIESGGGAGRLQFQLTWQTPADLEPGDDRGADVDLEVSVGDVACNPANPTPDWPPEGPINDPVYDADDRSGGGPENIIIDSPVAGETYQVGAVYDDPNGFGPSFATIRVFLDGALVREETSELLLEGDRRDFEFRFE